MERLKSFRNFNIAVPQGVVSMLKPAPGVHIDVTVTSHVCACSWRPHAPCKCVHGILHVWRCTRMQRLCRMHERRACTREHIDIRPRRFSRRSEQNFNDPRYQSRRVSTDRSIDSDQHHGIPCSLTLYGTEAHYIYIVPNISQMKLAIWFVLTDSVHLTVNFWFISLSPL